MNDIDNTDDDEMMMIIIINKDKNMFVTWHTVPVMFWPSANAIAWKYSQELNRN